MKVRNWWNTDNVGDDNEAKLKAVTLFLKDIYNILNKGFTLNDNAKGALLVVDFEVSNTDTQVRHGLDFVPSNYILFGSDVLMSIYDGTEPANETFIYLRASAIGTARVFLF